MPERLRGAGAADLTKCGPTSATAPNLILGTVDNYSFYEIEPFLESLRQSGFCGHLCLFAGPNISPRTIARIRAGGAEVVPYSSAFPFVVAPHPNSPKSLPKPIHIFNYRHFLYYDYLLKHEDRFSNVLLTDVKDVVFQADPFEGADAERISVAMETTAVTVGQCYWTRGWILDGYGADVAERLATEELSCAGTTMGPVHLMKRYLALMLQQIALMKDAYRCADQAAHNLLLHEGKLEPARRMYNFEGFILTVGTEPGYRLDERGRLVNRDGSVIAVVHQYDRHEELRRLFERKVRPNALLRTFSRTLHWWKSRLGWRIERLRRIVTAAH